MDCWEFKLRFCSFWVTCETKPLAGQGLGVLLLGFKPEEPKRELNEIGLVPRCGEDEDADEA